MSAEDQATAAAVVAAARPGVAPTSVTRLSAGASRRTLAVSAPPGPPLVVQVDQGAPGGGDHRAGVAAQGELMRRAAAAGVPVPEVVLVDGDGALVGAPLLVTAAVAGETVARRIHRDDALAAARRRFAADCGRALAALHGVDPAGLGLAATDPLGSLRDSIDATGEPRPTFELALGWLAAHRPAPGRPTLVHGDFRLGNLVIGPGGLAAVLDWELAHLGDPLEDLGWLCSVAWRFGGQAPVGGIGSRDDLLGSYIDAGGGPVDAAALRWWEVRAALAWGVICQRQARRHLDGTTPSMELAAIGRRVAEAEWDLLGLLWPGTRPAAASAGAESPEVDPTGGLHGRPSAAELVDATAMWLGDDVAPSAGAELAWHVRVAANVLATVSRELRLGPRQVAAHAARLAALGAGGDDAAVAGAVRAGEVGTATPGLLEAVAAGVADRLAVANPSYLARALPA